MKLEYIIKINDNYKTVNDVLNLEFSVSARLRLRLIRQNRVCLNGIVCDTRNSVVFGDKIYVNLDFEEESSNIVPTEMKLNIIYEDEWLLVLNKPAGIAVHPSMLHYENSLSNGVKFYFASIGLKKKIRPVNRLDRNTSGLVVFAKCEYIQECLSNQMTNGQFKKEYLALVSGKFDKLKRNY
ncbi:MAG: RluA family pseudouridine synthase [Clostridia bacterium]|nr:RluA family pseudouridine synthase [Clostridia bacterium]